MEEGAIASALMGMLSYRYYQLERLTQTGLRQRNEALEDLPRLIEKRSLMESFQTTNVSGILLHVEFAFQVGYQPHVTRY